MHTVNGCMLAASILEVVIGGGQPSACCKETHVCSTKGMGWVQNPR